MFKKILLTCILLCLCAGCADSENFNDPHVINKLFMQEGDILIQEIQTDDSGDTYIIEYTYNENGELIKAQGNAVSKWWLDINEYHEWENYRVIYKYENSLLTGEAAYNKAVKYIYNEQNNVSQRIYESDYSIITVEYKYNDKGMLVEEIETSYDKKDEDDEHDRIDQTTYQYDVNNRLICKTLITTITWSGSYSRYEYNYEYRDKIVNVYRGSCSGYIDDIEKPSIEFEKEPYEIYEYNENGNLIRYVDSSGEKHLYQYDSDSKMLIQEVYHENGKLYYSVEYIYATPVPEENPDYAFLWPTLEKAKEQTKLDNKKTCPACNGTGYMRFSAHGSDLEAALNGYDSWYYFKCTSCDGKGY